MPLNIISEQSIEHLLIHGLGVEGRAALEYFVKHTNAKIIAVDRAETLDTLPDAMKQRPRTKFLTEADCRDFDGMHEGNTLYLRSPGVPPNNPLVQMAQASHLYVTTPTGYWLARHAPKHTITITGTKGKSSTTALTAEILKWCGRQVEIYGNIGTPPLGAHPAADSVAIVELSSYMMHDLPPASHFHVITNLYTEHTDWHGTHEAYVAAKLRPFMTIPTVAGLATKDIKKELTQSPAQLGWVEDIVHIKDNHIQISEDMIDAGTLNPIFQAPSMLLALRTGLAIALATRLATPEQLIDILIKHLPDWQGLSHRQEIIPSTDGKVWVDDSLATVPEATLSALIRWQKDNIHLLLGGKDRGQNFTSLAKHCKKHKNIHIYAFGETVEKIQKTLPKTFVFDTLEDMIKAAKNTAQENDVILFSPAASSGTPHANYKERADIFRNFIE